MSPLRVLAGLLMSGTALAQIQPPPPCPAALTDHEVFRVTDHHITFHLKFHAGSSTFDANALVKLHRRGAADTSCTDGEVLDLFIDELVKKRNQFLPSP